MAKKTIAPPVIGTTEEAPETTEGAYSVEDKTYRLTPDFAMAVMNIIQLSMMSAEYGDKYAVNAAEEIGSIVLIANPNDPTGTSLTVHPAWAERFSADAVAFLQTAERLSQELMAADKAIEETAKTPGEDRS